MTTAAVRAMRRPLGGRRLAALAWRVALLAAVTASAMLLTIKLLPNQFLFDFNGDLLGAGHAILAGHNPYHPGYLAALAAIKRAGGITASGFALPVYPAPTLLAAVPFSLIPHALAGMLFIVLMVAAMVVGLRLLGVRDWRCIAIALVSWPFLYGLVVGNLGPALVLGTGVAWRFRARLWAPAIAVASVVVAKVFPWTLLVWLLVTRRFRTLARALLTGTVAVFVAWAAIGFDGMSEYPRMLSNLAFVEKGAGVSLVAALLGAGVPGALAEMIALGVAALLLFAAYRFAGRPHGDARALGLTVIAALTASPIVWPHYFVLLFVPVALASPSLSAVWFMPLLTALVPTPNPHSLLQMLFWISLEATVGVHLCLSPASRRTIVGEMARSRRRPRGSADHSPAGIDQATAVHEHLLPGMP